MIIVLNSEAREIYQLNYHKIIANQLCIHHRAHQSPDTQNVSNLCMLAATETLTIETTNQMNERTLCVQRRHIHAQSRSGSHAVIPESAYYGASLSSHSTTKHHQPTQLQSQVLPIYTAHCCFYLK